MEREGSRSRVVCCAVALHICVQSCRINTFITLRHCFRRLPALRGSVWMRTYRKTDRSASTCAAATLRRAPTGLLSVISSRKLSSASEIRTCPPTLLISYAQYKPTRWYRHRRLTHNKVADGEQGGWRRLKDVARDPLAAPFQQNMLALMTHCSFPSSYLSCWEKCTSADDETAEKPTHGGVTSFLYCRLSFGIYSVYI